MSNQVTAVDCSLMNSPYYESLSAAGGLHNINQKFYFSFPKNTFRVKTEHAEQY